MRTAKKISEILRVRLTSEKEVARHLLRDRAATGDLELAGAEHQPARTRDALPVVTRVFVETRVLDRDKRFLDLLGHVGNLDGNAAGLAERRNQLVIGRVHPERHLQAYIAQRFHGRQARRDQPVRHGDADDRQQNTADGKDQRISNKS